MPIDINNLQDDEMRALALAYAMGQEGGDGYDDSDDDRGEGEDDEE